VDGVYSGKLSEESEGRREKAGVWGLKEGDFKGRKKRGGGDGRSPLRSGGPTRCLFDKKREKKPLKGNRSKWERRNGKKIQGGKGKCYNKKGRLSWREAPTPKDECFENSLLEGKERRKNLSGPNRESHNPLPLGNSEARSALKRSTPEEKEREELSKF